MLKLYLISIVIWAIMIYGTAYLFNNKIKENGWLELSKSQKNPYIPLVLSSAIPVIRVFFFLAVIIMVGMTPEKFEEFMNEIDDKQG